MLKKLYQKYKGAVCLIAHGFLTFLKGPTWAHLMPAWGFLALVWPTHCVHKSSNNSQKYNNYMKLFKRGVPISEDVIERIMCFPRPYEYTHFQ